MERKVIEYLQRLFPRSSIIENACYLNPDKDGDEAEADAIVIWGPILIVVEAKGRKVDQRFLRGQAAQLRNTISNNIQDAFFQADRVIRALKKDKPLTFKEKRSGRKVSISRLQFRRLMPVSVTLQHFSGIPTWLAITRPLGLFKENSYPWSVSINDLDVITQFSGTPDIFLHYIERRIKHQSNQVEFAGDELDLFGHYLDNRLHPSIYEFRSEIKDHEGPRSIAIDGGEEKFAPFYTEKWYDVQIPHKKPDLDVPENIRLILQELRRSDDDDARYIAFALLGLSPRTLFRIHDTADRFRKGPPPSRDILRTTFSEDDTVVNLLAHASLGDEEILGITFLRSRIEHYKFKAKSSISICIDLRSSQIFQTAQWLECDWVFEPEIEKLLQEDKVSPRTYILPEGALEPGRNSRCPCGSGIKFKKCCQGKVDFRH